jgi:RNA polymerase sigma-70 factor, ECF subfamily
VDELAEIRRLKRGDIGGLEALVSRYQVKALRVAFLITQDKNMAEDVFQDVCLEIFKHIHGFDERRPFEPYLMSSIVHACLNRLRRDRKEVPWEENESLFNVLRTQTVPVEAEIEMRERNEAILAALSKLGPKERIVIVQRYFLEMSEQEMKAFSGKAVGTVKWYLNSARKRLRKLIQRKGGVE